MTRVCECLAVAFGVLTLAGACNDDAEILWLRDGSGGEDPSTTTASVGGMVDHPPPPDPEPFVPCGEGDPGGPPCSCPANSTCICEPVPDMLPCQMICEEVGCQMICAPDQPCDTQCGYACTTECAPGSMCTALCSGDCTVYCPQGAFCSVFSIEGPSTMYCEDGAICDCNEMNNCVCFGIGCEQQP